MSDRRLKTARRRLIIDITDRVNLPFDIADMEKIGECVQAALSDYYDVNVEDVRVETFSDYKGEYVPDRTR